MSKSLNKLHKDQDTYTKEYGGKKPLWKYILRSILNDFGIAQPVEYYTPRKRILFETNTLLLWKKYSLNAPKVINAETNRLILSKLQGKTLEELFSSNNCSEELLSILFNEINSRHALALKYNEKKLAHVDANLRNILFYENQIFHVDFEMGREYETTEMWLQRELSKLLISILEKQNKEQREKTLYLFFKSYKHMQILRNLFKSKLGNKLYLRPLNTNSTKYSLEKIIFDIQSCFPKIFLDIMLQPPINILIIYSARFGDILMSTPTVRAIKESWTNSSITFLTHSARKEILTHTPLINKVGSISNNTVYLSMFNITKNYDLAFVINKDNENFVKYALNTSKYTIAFATHNKDIDKKLFIQQVYPKQHSKHSVDMRLSLIERLNIFPSKKQLEYIVTKEEDNGAKEFLNSLKNKFFIGIQANSFHTKPYRNWPIANFINLCKVIMKEKSNVYFLLFGSNDDVKNLIPLQNEFRDNCSILAGKLTLRQTAAIMQRINLYIGVDTGPTHIMGTFNKPMIVLYHCFNSSFLLMPLENPNFIPIDHPIKNLGYKEPPMSDISVESVFEQVKKFL